MCNLNDYMRCANVISKTYLLPKDKLELAYRDFFQAVDKTGAKMASLPFFISAPAEGDTVSIRLYLPMLSTPKQLPPGLHFDSYFLIEDMASLAVCGEGIDAKVEQGYQRLEGFLDEQGLAPATPVFHILRADDSLTYTILKVGYRQKQDVEIIG
jgi:hypothetical protein